MLLDDPYLVPRADGRLVVGATREFAGWDARVTAAGVNWLLNEAVKLVPALAACAVQEFWTGFRPLSEDGLPLIGPGETEGLYFITGHGPSGIAPLPGSVALLMAQIEGLPVPVPAEPFRPDRFSNAV
jgi:glycine oxidase